MMSLTIEIKCPRCHNPNISRNGKKSNGKQNYLCKDCGRRFISEQEMTYRGCHSWVGPLVKSLLVRGMGIRDISAVLEISIRKVLNVLTSSTYEIKPKHSHYDCLEVAEFWTYVGEKKHKIWLIYAYHRESREIVAFVWGKRDVKKAAEMRERLHRLGISYERIATDGWDSFLAVFGEDEHLVGKKYTVGIKENNCRLRQRMRRVFRRTCCFSKNLLNHRKAFDMVFFYLNYGFL